jgi:uncharacterized protein
MVYIDASAAVKLVLDERESGSLRRELEATPLIASSVLVTELLRAVRRVGGPVGSAVDAIARIHRIQLSDEILLRAGGLDPVALRSLDAIHLASALMVGPHVQAFVTYDRVLGRAARVAGLNVLAPR